MSRSDGGEPLVRPKPNGICSYGTRVVNSLSLGQSLQKKFLNVRQTSVPLTFITYLPSKLQDMTTLDVQQQNAIYADYNRQHPELQEVIKTVASCNCNCRIRLAKVAPCDPASCYLQSHDGGGEREFFWILP
jgi:hypothetical protein